MIEDSQDVTAYVDGLIASGGLRADRHRALLPSASPDYPSAEPYTIHELQRFERNAELYARLWGPLPTADDYEDKLEAWLETDEASRTVRGTFLLGNPDVEDVDEVTRRWLYNPSDLEAARNGCFFDLEKADAVCSWFESELVLYEGSAAGKPFRLLDWQREMLSRVFGWQRWSEDVGKHVRRFTKASVWIPKKNGKSPLGAGVGLLLFLQDGEGGQKVYNIASVLKQALIVHKHAEQFVRRKDRAKGKHNDWGCRVYKTLGDRRIGHAESGSEYAAISGENPRSLEGLNAGGIIVDECHVMDVSTAAVIEEAGASRDQPLQFEISTAGNNLESYGKRQYDYGRAVERGLISDQRFFFQGFGIFEESHHNPSSVETWQRSNPSWFVTIKPETFGESHRTASQKGIREFNKWQMYRLNRWIAASEAWLDPLEWEACQREFTMDGEKPPCWIGVDLARCRDMSAVTATWRDGENVFQRTWLWVTRNYVEMWADKAPWLEWESEGCLSIVPGGTIPTAWPREKIEELAESNAIQRVCYDEKFATELAAWLEHEARLPHTAMPQGSRHMTEPLDDFEAYVKEQRLWIYPSSCLTWQAKHVSLKEEPTGGRRLVKPPFGEWKKIDGMVASVMSLYATKDAAPVRSGPLFIT